MVAIAQAGPSGRWTELRYHAEQARLWNSAARFKVVAAGRRSGKTELAKRAGIREAFRVGSALADAMVCFGAPTQDQARRIFWDDLKALVPARRIVSINETRLEILTVLGATIRVFGLDKPARIEGAPIDWLHVDELADVKKGAWEKHIRPALSTPGRLGRAWLTGVPEGMGGDFWRLYNLGLDPNEPDFESFHWKSADILPEAEISSARRNLDPKVFEQEYEAGFVSFAGRAYYCFDRSIHAVHQLQYQAGRPLIFCFDFNRAPGVALIAQEQDPPTVVPPRMLASGYRFANSVTMVIGQVYIPKDSNTKRVCERLVADWKHHTGPVHLYGDPTGGNKGTAKNDGSDWNIISDELRPKFRGGVIPYYAKHPKSERGRVNALNSRLTSADGTVGLLIDHRLKETIDDIDVVKTLEGTMGDLDKTNELQTHLSDAIGYYAQERYPIGDQRTLSMESI